MMPGSTKQFWALEAELDGRDPTKHVDFSPCDVVRCRAECVGGECWQIGEFSLLQLYMLIIYLNRSDQAGKTLARFTVR